MSDAESGVATNTNPGATATAGADVAGRRLDFWTFVVMLVLAIVGAGLSQADHSGGSRYWLVLVVIYGLISTARAWVHAKRQDKPVWPMIRAQVFHWLGALAAIQIVLMFEMSGITDRGPASDFALLLLALSCFLAGVHFDWPLMLVGAVLAAIAVGLGFLDQLSVYLVAVPLAALAVWFVFKHKIGKSH